MKLKHWCLFGVALLLSLSSCRGDRSDDVTPGLSSEETTSTKRISLNLSAGMADEELRMLYGVKTDDSGALSGLSMQESNVILRIITKQMGNDSRAIAQDIEFVKVPGENRAVFSGDITVPTSSSSQPYQIAAILVERVGGTRPYPHELYTRMTSPTEISAGSYIRFFSDMDLRKASSNKLSMENIPYASKWQTIPVNSADNTARPVALHLDPMGTLLRVRIKNATNSPVSIYALKMVSDAFTTGIDILQPLSDNGSVDWRTANTLEHVFRLPSGSITVAPNGQSDWLYTWLMPRTTTQAVSTSLRLALDNGTPQLYSPDIFSTREPLPLGSVPMVITYRGNHTASFGNFADIDTSWGSGTNTQPKLAIEYLAAYAFNKAGNGFVNNYATDNPDVGWFTYQQMMSKFSTGIAIGGKRYSVPTPDEMASIFPRLVGSSANGTDRFAPAYGPSFNLIEENVKIGNVTQNYFSDYFPTVDAVYAVRFKNSSNRNKTAFRYRIITEGTSRSMLVECVYLGNTRFEALEDISKPSFWTANASQVVKRQIPLYGGRTYPNGMDEVRQIADVNGSVMLGLNAPQFDKATIQFGAASIQRSGLGPHTYLVLSSIFRDFPVIPFER